MIEELERNLRDEAPGVQITSRELEVLRLAAQGLSSQEMADLLFVSRRTIDFHLLASYRKLGVTNRIQAIRAVQALQPLSNPAGVRMVG